MRCKKHISSDPSSTVGVCATCLTERLTSLIEAQAQLTRVSSRASDECSRSSNPNPPPPPPHVFPRSVSPYVSGRKSDFASSCDGRDQLFFSTPQVGPTFYGVASAVNGNTKRWKKRLSKFLIFSNPFRSRSEKFKLDASCEQSSSASSPSWFSTILQDHRRNRSRFGMSPARTENFSDDCNRTPSEATQWWRRTPSSANSTRRSRPGLEKSVSDSGLAFCMSPLVRWNHKGLPPETVAAAAAASKPHLSTAASFCANRSRKLADYGKVNHNR